MTVQNVQLQNSIGERNKRRFDRLMAEFDVSHRRMRRAVGGNHSVTAEIIVAGNARKTEIAAVTHESLPIVGARRRNVLRARHFPIGGNLAAHTLNRPIQDVTGLVVFDVFVVNLHPKKVKVAVEYP